MSVSYQVGVDIGGTFTDFVLLDEAGSITTLKVPSTPHDYNAAIETGLTQLLKAGRGTSASLLAHATTVATNALLEKRGARVGLITTEGFRDVLEIRRGRMPVLYDLGWQRPEPLVPRFLRKEVGGRISATGVVRVPLDEAAVAGAVAELLEEKIDVLAVALINSYVNAAHERKVAEIVRSVAPSLPFCLSCEVLPEAREYERTSTTVVNSFLLPVVGKYLARLEDTAANRCPGAGVRVIQSSGALTDLSAVRDRPIDIIESGPAAGVVAAARIAKQLGLDQVIAFDMGGTTAKAAIVSGGRYGRVFALDVGEHINHGSRLLQGRGYHVSVPAIDIAEVGAGAGSFVRLDAAGGVVVGPESAGAVPGPVCYRRGGSVPTVTDANVIVGFLNDKYLVGGELEVDRDAAEAAIDENVARRLSLTVEEAAFGIHQVASAAVARAVKAVTSEQGKDPSQFALIAFGGSGPVHAASLAAMLGIQTILVPPAAGVLSALGLLFSREEDHRGRSIHVLLADADYARLVQEFEANESDTGAAHLSADSVLREVGLRYSGAEATLYVPMPRSAEKWRDQVRQAFDEEHAQTFGYISENEALEIVTIRSVVRPKVSLLEEGPRALKYTQKKPGEVGEPRQVYFGKDAGWHEVPVLRRDQVMGTMPGPLIVEEYEGTTVVPPGYSVSRTTWDVLALAKCD